MKLPKDLIQEINKIVGEFNSKTYKKMKLNLLQRLREVSYILTGKKMAI